jgi:hypothetical protein
MSAIDNKYNALKKLGLDLGAPLSAEQSAPAGGRVRAYQRGNIYWHRATGAHEVHGGILKLYLAQGGPGPNPKTGTRDLGYPTSDEHDSPLGARLSSFETGAIFWTPGTRGCVLFGGLWEWYQTHPLGLPLTGNTPLVGGTVVYCERGVLFQAPAPVPGADSWLVGTIDPPLMGCPVIISPEDQVARRWTFSALWQTFSKATYEAVTAWRPTIFADLWKDRLALSPVGSPFSLTTLEVETRSLGEDQAFIEIEANFAVPATARLADRTLYDLQLNLPAGVPYRLSPHCLYTKKSWSDFGLFHITDLHVNRKNDLFRAQLQALGLADAAQHYSNFQDSLRDFVRYANKLHAAGLADAVIATGDLVDYVSEDGDPSYMNNFVRLRQLLLGQPFDGRDAAGEELRLPIFTTFGNHDYRLHPYDLDFNLDIPLVGSKNVANFSSHNLLESDAIALEGGHTPSYGVTELDKPFRMIQYGLDPEVPGGEYSYYEKYFSHSRSYAVALGDHRLVMLDTKYDDGVPSEAPDVAFFVDYLVDSPSLGLGLPESTKKLIGGGVPSVGISGAELGLVRQALKDAGANGVVIVGMHAPVLSPVGHEYPYFFRETLHPTADPRLTDAFVKRNKLHGDSWSRTGTGYFKTGDNGDGMDSDTIANNANDFIRVCAGVGQPRPVDLVLYGHIHDRVEYRVRWNAAAGRLEYYTDFYTENPSVYYHTIGALPPLPPKTPIAIDVDPKAAPNAAIALTTYHPASGSDALPLRYGILKTPPYAAPLSAAADAKGWWEAHRPILAQTSALGPMDPRQRYGTFWEIDPVIGPRLILETDRKGPPASRAHALPAVLPDPPVQGFRFVQVSGNAIWRMRYVGLRELRRNNFTMPWETEVGPHVVPHPVPRPGPIVARGPA